MQQFLKFKNYKFNYIIQISDIHIRLYKRQDEYKQYFDKFYKELENLTNNGYNEENTLLLISGDVFHTKTSLSAEAVDLASDFFRECSTYFPVLIIPGNHDFMLSNRNRLDNISPIVNALEIEDIIYLKDSGLFKIGNILINNFSAFDEHDPDKYIKFKDIPDKYKYTSDHIIALCHAAVNGASDDIGYTISNRLINCTLFDGHEIVMLGDIHKHQILQDRNEYNKKPLVVYAGSFLQQNYGENLHNHGYLIWDLSKCNYELHEINNDYGYYTIEVKDGKLLENINKLDDIPINLHLRIMCCNTLPSQLKDIVERIKDKYNLIEVTYVRTDCLSSEKETRKETDITLSNIGDVNYQNRYIENFLKEKGVDEKTINEVKQLNIQTNSKVSKEYKINSVRWKPKKFEFDNMFSYGEGNVIDFAKLNGIIGLFAKNSAGKSSILEALTFCIFDKFSKGFKASDVINNQKNSFWCKFNFEIAGEDYYIERSGEFTKRGTVPVSVQFYKIVNGEKISLNGDARSSTNDIIRDYLGTYEDFILTVLSVQNNKYGSFIDLSQSERKDMLCQFMGLNIFDQLLKIANDEKKEVSILLKNMDYDDLSNSKSRYESENETYKKDLVRYKNTVSELEIKKKEKTDEWLDISSSIKGYKEKVIDINKLIKQKSSVEGKISKLKSDIETKNSEIEKYDIELNRIKNTILTEYSKYNIQSNDDLITKYNDYVHKVQDLQSKQSELDKLKIILDNKIKLAKKLDNYEYDSNCQYCMNNIFVKDAFKAKEELKNQDAEIWNLSKNEVNNCKSIVDSLKYIETLYTQVSQYTNQISSVELKKSGLSNVKLENEHKLKEYESDLNDINENIEEYHNNELQITKNIELKQKEAKLKKEIDDLDYQIKTANNNIIKTSTNIGKNESFIKTIENDLSKYKELDVKNNYYNFYTMAIDRNGVPYNIIRNELPNIESEINNILHQIVDFTIKLETDGKNIITNINYNDNIWSLEMCGGMEKFISSLAIRIALINISNLPRPNMLCIDEGFGCVDTEHLDQMGSLFSYLKNQFEFIWVISHIDQMKDIVDLQLEIEKDGSFSKIQV